MATESKGKPVDYRVFKQRLEKAEFMGTQNMALKLRLEVLESFFKPETVKPPKHQKGGQAQQQQQQQQQIEDIWDFKKGTLTIVDLSCPFIGPDDACALFNICISLFLEGRGNAGRIVALDEAHKVSKLP